MVQLKRRAWVRFYPTFVFVVALAQRALALECVAVDREGQPAPDGAIVQAQEQIEVAVHHQVAATRMSYRFQNRHSAPLEITCELRLGAHELIDGFSYWNGGEQVVGEVLERAAATQVYEDLAKVQRRDPGMLEQNGDVFRFRVFPIAPGEDKRVELRSVIGLSLRDGYLEYRMQHANFPAQAGFSLEAELSDELELSDVALRGGTPSVQRLAANHVRLSQHSDLPPAGDLVLRYRVRSQDYALRLMSHRERGSDGSFMLIVSPKDAVGTTDAIGRDIVFVTDVSGSMHGTPLEQAKLGLYDMLARLGKEDRFEVISFDDQSYPMFGQLTAADEHSRDDALGRVQQLQTRGGTNIHGALLRAIEMLREQRAGRARAIVLLTDGQGDEPAEVVAADVREHAAGVRIYSVGVGEGVDRTFLERLSEENRGLSRFVSSGEHIEDEMQRLYARIAMPLMLDLKLEVEGGDVYALYPRQLPDLYRDGEVIVFGRYRRAGHAVFRLKGRLKDSDKQLTLSAELPAEQAAHAELEKLWASQRVSSLLASRGARGEDPELTQEVTRLGIVYNLVTPYTTFVAVPASLQTAEVKAQIRQGRLGYEKKLIDSMQGIRLSQAEIPPGDPVLSVEAPGDARQVVAYFPFGLVKRLAWDAVRSRWYVRFLVPRDVKDGRYEIRVQIVRADGVKEWKQITYTIDGNAPELEVHADAMAMPGKPFHITVDPDEPVSSVYVYLSSVSLGKRKRVALKLDPDTGLYSGDLRIPEASGDEWLKVRVVARDRAHNRVEQELKVPLLVSPDC
jgi:Ca-activated chloride channel family protein